MKNIEDLKPGMTLPEYLAVLAELDFEGDAEFEFVQEMVESLEQVLDAVGEDQGGLYKLFFNGFMDRLGKNKSFTSQMVARGLPENYNPSKEKKSFTKTELQVFVGLGACASLPEYYSVSSQIHSLIKSDAPLLDKIDLYGLRGELDDFRDRLREMKEQHAMGNHNMEHSTKF